jgi:hypothetical protein
MFDARSNALARLLNKVQLEKKCNPPEFRISTLWDDVVPAEWFMRCCDAREFNGAGDGCSSHDGNRADLVEAAVSARAALDDEDKISPAELLYPTGLHPCLRETRYVKEGPNPTVPCDTVPTRLHTPCPLRRYCARADKAADIIPRRPSIETVIAEDAEDELLITFFGGKKEGINPT